MTFFRRIHRRASHYLVLLLIVAGWGVPLGFPHLSSDDLLCAPASISADSPVPRIVADREGPETHCAVCHTLRSLRDARLDSSAAILALVSPGIAPAPRASSPVGSSSDRLPARAPPV